MGGLFCEYMGMAQQPTKSFFLTRPTARGTVLHTQPSPLITIFQPYISKKKTLRSRDCQCTKVVVTIKRVPCYYTSPVAGAAKGAMNPRIQRKRRCLFLPRNWSLGFAGLFKPCQWLYAVRGCCRGESGQPLANRIESRWLFVIAKYKSHWKVIDFHLWVPLSSTNQHPQRQNFNLFLDYSNLPTRTTVPDLIPGPDPIVTESKASLFAENSLNNNHAITRPSPLYILYNMLVYTTGYLLLPSHLFPKVQLFEPFSNYFCPLIHHGFATGRERLGNCGL